MARHKEQAMPDEDDNYGFPESEQNEDDYNFNSSTQKQGDREGLNNMPTIDKFLDPEDYLYRVKKSMLGFELRDGEYIRVTYPWATSRFINLFINSLRSVLTQHTMWSSIRSEEAAFTIMEKLKEIIFAAVDMGVKNEHLETIVNIFDNSLQLFYGIIIDGKGRENIKQVLTSVYDNIEAKQNNQQNLFNLKTLKKGLKGFEGR